MTDNTELQRLIRLRRLTRQITASLPADLDCEQASEVHGSTLSKAALRAELETALANYHGPVTLCPPAPAPEPDRGQELDLFAEDEVGGNAVTGR